jgi:hypothetical protein
MTQDSVKRNVLTQSVHRSKSTALPRWAREILLSESPAVGPMKGHVLRLKLGYNPNSSSVGSGVYVLPILLLLISSLFGAVAGLISSAFAPRRDKTREVPQHDTSPNTRGTGSS